MTIITDNISALRLVPLADPAAWQVRFHSTNLGCCHQLYVNGRLVDATDTTPRRTFDVLADSFAQELAVVAVPSRHRNGNFAHELPAGAAAPPWLCRLRLPRNTANRPGDRLAVHHDNATGTVDETPALRENLWPPQSSMWGFGVDAFGRGGFGLDAAAAPGLAGAFGLGPFGIDREVMTMDLPLTADGLHAIEARAVSFDGETSTAATTTFTAAPPPPPAIAIQAVDYDPDTQRLTFQITRT